MPLKVLEPMRCNLGLEEIFARVRGHDKTIKGNSNLLCQGLELCLGPTPLTDLALASDMKAGLRPDESIFGAPLQKFAFAGRTRSLAKDLCLRRLEG